MFVPSDWIKVAFVPIHKKGNRQNVSNYRPVSLFPVLNEVFERTI